MNQEVKAKWLAALRSGEFEQGKRFLRVEDRFCCLGVLCHLAVEEGVAPASIPEAGRAVWSYGALEKSGTLPAEVIAWADIGSSDPFAGAVRLTTANDGGSTFEEIADMIERAL